MAEARVYHRAPRPGLSPSSVGRLSPRTRDSDHDIHHLELL